jgi:predicted phage tail protein
MFTGSKGGSPAQPQETLTPDNLRSQDTMEAIFGLCEGPIGGPVGGMQGFYVGTTPLENTDGTFNFNAFTVNFWPGSATPDPIVPALGGISNNTSVNVLLFSQTAVIRETSTGELDYIDVRIVINDLLVENSNGTFNNTVRYKIHYKAISDPNWIAAFNPTVDGELTITGKCTSPYVLQWRIPVARISEPYNIRVIKDTPEDTTTEYSSITWESFQEITVESPTHPYTACLQVVGMATNQFSSIPQFWCLADGLNELKVPTNYDPVALTYTGVWDGTFKLALTSNPAWFLYNFVINTSWGLGHFYPVTIDPAEVYEAAQWCDQMVPDGSGGYQPRYTFNMLISNASSGIDMARYIAGAFNAAFIDNQDGTVSIKVDKDDAAVALFTAENVTSDGFSYSYSDLTSRYNDLTVTFNNADLSQYAQDTRRVFDQTQIDANNDIPLDFIAVGCTNEHEAIRRATYKMITATTEVETVSFATNRQGRFIQAFDVILVSDPDMGYALSGRFKSLDSTRKIVTLRDTLYLEAGIAYALQAQTPDGLFSANILSPTTGYNSTLTLDTAVPILPDDRAPFTVSQGTAGIGAPKPYRVLSISEVSGDPESIQISATEINRLKWAGADGATPVGTIPYSFTATLTSCLPPTGLTLTSAVGSGANGIQVNIVAAWTASATNLVRKYLVYYSCDDGPTLLAGETPGDETITIYDVADGTYYISVIAQNIGGINSAPAVGTIVIGATSPLAPSAVTGLELTGQGNDTVFVGQDANFDWRMNSTLSAAYVNDSNAAAGSGSMDPTFTNYIVNLYDPISNLLLRTEMPIAPSYTYSYVKNAGDAGGPRRSFRIEVAALDNYNQTSVFSKLTVSNPSPNVLEGVTLTPSFSNIFVSFTAPTDLDYAGVLIWMSETTGFTPGPDNLVYNGPGNVITLPGTSGVTYYLRLAAYDLFGTTGLNVSQEYSVTTAYVNNADLAPAFISEFNDMSGELITVSGSVSTLSGSVTTLGSQMGTVESQYVVKINSGGKIAGFGLATTSPDADGSTSAFIIEADKFAIITTDGTDSIVPFIVEGDYVYIDGAKIGTASIQTASIATAAIDTALIADGAITTAKIGTAQITSATIGNLQVTSAQIDNLTVGTGKIATDAITTVVSAYTAGPTTFAANAQVLQEATISTNGGLVSLNLSCTVDSFTVNQATFTIIRSGTTLATIVYTLCQDGVATIGGDVVATYGGTVVIPYLDLPSASTYTYSVEMSSSEILGGGNPTVEIANASILLLEIKR